MVYMVDETVKGENDENEAKEETYVEKQKSDC